jgi:FkbM family methyltransferase
VVLDVGANIGFYAVPFSSRLRTLGGRLHCFEPVPANVERLKLNLRINGLEDSATVWRIGLSNRTSSANITLLEDFAAGAETGNAAILAYAGAAKQPWIEIAVRTLEDAWPRLGESRLDFIKVDIEGHEDLFFDGAIGLIRAHRPYIAAEMNEDFFAASGVNLDERIGGMFRELRYRWMKFDRSGQWRLIETLCGRRADEDVLLVAEERLDAAFAALHSR